MGSKTLAADPDLGCGPSTIRSELALLEEAGLITHPHTSAGRVPTDAGRRYYVDHLPATRERSDLALPLVRRELDDAMRSATATLAQVTNLLAIVSAPPLDTATIRHVEVLLLQPQVAMVVVITSTGGVSKRMLTFDDPVDPGLVSWAGAYLNERLQGVGLGRADAPRAAARRLAGRERAAVPRRARAGVPGPPVDRGGHGLRRRRRAAPERGPPAGRRAGQRAADGARAPRDAARRAARGARRARRARADRQRERAAGAAVAGRRRGRLRAAGAQARHGLGDRPGADGLPGGDRDGARGGRRSSRATSRTSTRAEAARATH